MPLDEEAVAEEVALDAEAVEEVAPDEEAFAADFRAVARAVILLPVQSRAGGGHLGW